MTSGGASKNIPGSLSLAIFYGPLVNYVVIRPLVKVRHMVRVRLRVRLGSGFRSGQSQSVPPFRSVNYHILVKSGTRRSRSVPPFRSVPELIPTRCVRKDGCKKITDVDCTRKMITTSR